jgi:hypothetical protein
MQAAIDRVMHTYGMIVNLTPEQEQIAREKSQVFSRAPKLMTKPNWRSRDFAICAPQKNAVNEMTAFSRKTPMTNEETRVLREEVRKFVTELLAKKLKM